MQNFHSLFDGTPIAPYLASCESLLPAFLYNGSDTSSWEPESVREERNGRRLLRRASFLSPDGCLRYTLHLTLHLDLPAAEWLPELENVSDRPTGQISCFRSLALRMTLPDAACPECAAVTLQRNLGSRARHDDFMNDDIVLHPIARPKEEMACTIGKSSSDWLPYFGLRRAPGGFFHQFGIGWSGAWRACFEISEKGVLTAEAGLLKTDFHLHPGEKVRQASMFLVSHEPSADEEEAQNVTRRFMLENHSPRNSRGEVIRAPICFNVGGGIPRRMLLDILDTIRREKFNYDVLWMDAGWFGPDLPEEWPEIRREGDIADDTLGKWTAFRGDWRVNRGHHINGLSEYADIAKSMGMDFLLWFEIETCMPGMPVAVRHPEWFLPLDCGSLLLDLGNPSALQYAKEVIRSRILEEHIGMIRIDFNVNPLQTWLRTDPPGRTGITETKYITGLYELWDDIRTVLPDQAIDNCASGGRRLDFELLSRSIPLWRVDGCQTSESNQFHVANLSRWLPQHAGGVYGDRLSVGDDYSRLSQISTGALISYYPDQVARNPEWIRKLIRTTRRISNLFRQNLWNIFPVDPESETSLSVRQCDSFDHSEGFFIVFRRKKCPISECTVPLRRIDPDAEYELENSEGTRSVISGAELAQFRTPVPEPRSAYLFFYKKI